MINSSYSRKSDIKCGVLHGFVLGPLLFNIDLVDLFLECEDGNITRYAGDTTPYSYAQDISSVISELQRIATKIFDWRKNYRMKANPGKCHVILSSNTKLEIRVDNTLINPSHPNPRQREKIKLNFYFHTPLRCLKRFYEGLKAFIEPFKAPKRIVNKNLT